MSEKYGSSDIRSDIQNKFGSSYISSDLLILNLAYIEIIKNTQLSQGVNVKSLSQFCDISDRGCRQA